jgi:hypothetical protein
MCKRFTFFLVVLLLMFQGEIYGQPNPALNPIPKMKMVEKNEFKDCWSAPKLHPLLQKLLMQTCVDTISAKQPAFFLLKPLPASYYSNHLGFFCQKELQLDKVAPLPIRFRLGSLDYVNWMEQKPNAIKPR